MNSDFGIEVRIEKYLSENDPETRGGLLGNLKAEREPGTRQSRIKSRKLQNVVLNWKQLVFDVVPSIAGAVATMPSSAVAGALLALQALRSAAGLMEIELPEKCGIIVVYMADLARRSGGNWIALEGPGESIVSLTGMAVGEVKQNVQVLLRLGVAMLDADGTRVTLVEEIRFDPEELVPE